MPADPDSSTTAAGASRHGLRCRVSRTTWLFGLAALVVAGAIAAALFGLPVRTWFDQDSELQALEHELTEMQSVNHDLQGEVDRLQTDDGIREAARDELGHVQAGDKRQTMLELPPLPTDLPDGWPYSQVEAIIAVRAAVATPHSERARRVALDDRPDGAFDDRHASTTSSVASTTAPRRRPPLLRDRRRLSYRRSQPADRGDVDEDLESIRTGDCRCRLGRADRRFGKCHVAAEQRAGEDVADVACADCGEPAPATTG